MEQNVTLSTLEKTDTSENNCKISKFRNYASQIYATCATNTVKWTVGSCIGFVSIIVAELHKENPEIYMSTSDQTWFSSNCFMVPVGCIVLNLLAKYIGCRLTMLISSFAYFISFLIFHFAENAKILLAAQALAGLFFIVSLGPGTSYVVEISQPQLRSALATSTALSLMTAQFFVVFLSNFLHWRTIALVILAFPIIGFIAVWTIPESPHWLASKKKFEKAEVALCWLRGWSYPENVATEFNKLKESHTQSLCNSNSSKTTKNISFFNLSFFNDRSFYVPLSLTCLLYILHNCTGFSPVLIYSIVIFRKINAPVDPYVVASIFDAMRIVGGLTCIFCVHYTGKKKLMFITLSAAGLANVISSIALYLKECQIYSETCEWVATVAMILTSFFTSAGIDKIIHVLNAEIFPVRYRYVGTGIGLFVNYSLQAISNKFFFVLLDAVTLSGVFLIFGIACIVTCTSFHLMYFETEGKTLQDIEKHYRGVKKI